MHFSAANRSFNVIDLISNQCLSGRCITCRSSLNLCLPLLLSPAGLDGYIFLHRFWSTEIYRWRLTKKLTPSRISSCVRQKIVYQCFPPGHIFCLFLGGTRTVPQQFERRFSGFSARVLKRNTWSCFYERIFELRRLWEKQNWDIRKRRNYVCTVVIATSTVWWKIRKIPCSSISSNIFK